MVGTYGKPQMKKSRKVLVALSGGVDSAVAAALLKNQGLDVVGLHMQLWDPERQAMGCKFTTRCCQVADRDRAKGICQKLEIPFVAVDGRELFEEEVLDSIVHEAILLRTPNACFRCNERVRIPLLMKKADGKGRKAINEILIVNPAASAIIREGATQKLQDVIVGGKSEGMQFMDDAILDALKAGIVSAEEAYVKATDKNKFKAFLPAGAAAH
jgi:hypothetical protein